MLNTMADPDVEMASLKSLSKYLEGRPDTAVINHPSQIMKSSRDGNFRALQDVPGLYFPRTEGFDIKDLMCFQR